MNRSRKQPAAVSGLALGVLGAAAMLGAPDLRADDAPDLLTDPFSISLGTFIVTEATLSYLGIGLPSTSVSWGIDISAAQVELRSGSPILFYPATALAITVLSFMMLGDALRDALDPKARTR